MIPFNKSLFLGGELNNIKNCFKNLPIHISGNGQFTKKCEKLMEERYGFEKVLLTNSCTSALEISALILRKEISSKISAPEVIMPSFTFVSSANSFVKFGFKIKFIDINPVTMNLNEDLAKEAINENTVAIVAVNYGGLSCDMRKLRKICDDNKLLLIEDAAQSIDSFYDGKVLGSFGDLSAISFHETKNITSGEGGCLVINNSKFVEDAQVIREKGTNRAKFILGLVDKYSWIDIGGHYLMPDINAAFLYHQLENSVEVKEKRVKIWNQYQDGLKILEQKGIIELQKISDKNDINGHMFWIKTKNLKQRNDLIISLKKKEIMATFHYIPLHSSEAGLNCGSFFKEDIYTTKESERLLRLPLFYDLKESEVEYIISNLKNELLK